MSMRNAERLMQCPCFDALEPYASWTGTSNEENAITGIACGGV